MSKNSNTTLLLGAGAAVAILLFAKNSSEPSDTKFSNQNYIRPIYDGKPSTFIKLNYPFALAAKRIYPKVPVDLILTQSGLESAWGKSAVGNNFFGVKAGKDWKGEVQLLKTTEVLSNGSGYHFPEVISVTKMPSGKYHWVVKDYFKKYSSPLEGYLDYCKLITHGRYANAWATNDLKTIITTIWKDGYATDPHYPDKIMKIASLVDKQISTFA